jgi:hypothetical protein
MPPAATQNLNAKLSGSRGGERPNGAHGIRWEEPAIHSSAPPIRIVSAASRLRGGYRVNN